MSAKPETPSYLSGFANEFASEAVAGALPVGQNSPQKAPFGLYAEQISGTPFTAARGEARRSWLYRICPTASHSPYRRHSDGLLQGGAFDDMATTPNRLRWNPLPVPERPTDFVDGLVTMAGNGDAARGCGISIHFYLASRSMVDRIFCDADGELLLVPQQGSLRLLTEMGILAVAPGEIAVVPRGLRFRVELPDGPARGYVGENHGALLRLPELGPIGANGLANPRDFQAPVAWFEESDRPVQVVQKFLGHLWAMELDHSPLDVVAWHGNYVPYKYDLARFNAIGTVSFDHPDPSIFTVLTAPGERAGVANLDFVIFPPRWVVAEHSFRPPWFHRNVMSEFMGLVRGVYDAKADGFLPGGASLHNCMSGHGPDVSVHGAAVAAELKPQKIQDTLAFMFETRWVLHPTRFALETPALQQDYDECWRGFPNQFRPRI